MNQLNAAIACGVAGKIPHNCTSVQTVEFLKLSVPGRSDAIKLYKGLFLRLALKARLTSKARQAFKAGPQGLLLRLAPKVCS